MPDMWMDVDTALAEVPVNIMPLLDDTDFKTIEDAVAYNAAGMALFWHFVTSAGAYTVTAVTPTTAGVYDWTDQGTAGIYTIEIPASGGASINNDTEGYGWFTGKATGVLPWRGPTIGFRAAAINDALVDGGDNLDVNTVQWLGTACATPTVAGVPEVDVTHFNGTAGTFASGRPEVNTTHAAGTAWGSGAITAASIAADAITDAKVAADVTIASVTGAVGSVTAGVTVTTNNDKTGYGLSAAAVQAIWDALTTALTTVGSIGKKLADWVIGTTQTGDSFARLGAPAGASVSADIAAVKVDTAAILADTAEIGVAGAGLSNINLPNQTMDIVGNITGNLSGSVGSVTGLTAATVHSDLDDIQARLPAALTGAGNMKADVLALNGDATAAATLAILNGATVVYRGTVTGAATTTTLIDSGLTQASTDWWKGRIIIFTSVITLQATDITAFDQATDTLTFTAVTAAPTGATYIII